MLYPCTYGLCIAMSDKPFQPCKIHRDYPTYRASQPPIVATDHWKIEDPNPLHDRRRSSAPEQQDFLTDDDRYPRL